MRNAVALVLIFMVATVALAGNGKPMSGLAAGEPYYEYVPTDVLVKFKSAVTVYEMTSLTSDIGGRIAEWSEELDYYRVEISAAAKTEDAVSRFRTSPQVEWANFNYIAHALYTPNDEFYGLQWHYPKINMPQAWDITRGNANVVVAVCDQGFQFAHSDWAGVQTTSPHDFIDGDNDPSTAIEHSHGMHVAGTIIAATNNNIGVAGIAPLCTLMPIRALDDSGSGTSQQIADGITWSGSHGAEVLNLSLGFSVQGPPEDPGPPVSTAIASAANNGVVIFAATGNDAQPYIGYPAAYDQCIAVGSTGFDDVRAPYSNYGTGLDIVAPGGDMEEDLNGDTYGDGVLSTVKENGQWWYTFFQGTSMATPHACGVGALLISNGLAGSQVRQALQETAEDLSSPGWDNQYGYGRINALAALQWQGGGGGGDVILLNEPFESFPLQGWQVFENDADGIGWQTLAGTSADCGDSPHNGSNAVWHDDEDLVNEGHQDDWLVTPQLTIPANATAAVLTFWERNCYVLNYYEYHGLLYSTNGTDWTEVSQFDDVLINWDQVTVDLTTLAGSNVWFAWRYQGIYATEWFLDDVVLTVTVPEAVGDQVALPESMTLLNPYPNPFNSTAQIPFELSASARVELSVYNLLGQKVATLVNPQEYTAGRHQVAWDASGVTSGLYFVKLTSGEQVQTKKLLLVK